MDIKLNIHNDLVEHAKASAPVVVSPDTTVREVFTALQLHNAGSLLICEGGKPVGIFTERDALKLMAASADLDVPIRDIMIKDPVTVSRDASIAEAVKLMSAGGYRRLPIVDHDGSLAGVVKV